MGWDAKTDCVNQLIRRVATTTPGVALLDLGRYLCRRPDRQCRFTYHGAPLRPDGVHYSGRGARLVAQWILATMHIS